MTNWKIFAQTISLRSVDVGRAAISPIHKVPLCSKNVLEDEAHPLHHRIARRYAPIINKTINRDEEGLWLIVGSNGLQTKRVVRSWARRRLLQALSKQLEAHGFDTRGRRLKGENEEVVPKQHNIESLVGIVEVSVNDKSIHCKYDEILRQTQILAQEILARCGKPSRSSQS